MARHGSPWSGQGAGCRSAWTGLDDRCEMLEQLSPSHAPGELAWGDTGWIGNTRGCFERQLTCGVCGQNNLKINNLRRGRSPSGCNHFPETCPANGSMSLAWPAFSSKIFVSVDWRPCA